MTKYTKELLEEAVSNAVNYADVLRYLGIKYGSGSHAHITRMIKKFNIDNSHFTHTSQNIRNPF